MRTTSAPLLLLTILQAVYGQLNFEGNPLTEDTVYTAEESQFAKKTVQARSLETPVTEDSYLLAARTLKAERSRNQYQKKNDDGAKYGAHSASTNHLSSTNSYKTLPNDAAAAVFGTQTSETRYSSRVQPQEQLVNTEPPSPQLPDAPDPALVMFLNSKTPQESKIALEEYLIAGQRAEQTADASPSPYQPHISDIVLPQQELVNVAEQLKQIGQMNARYSPYASAEYPNSQLAGRETGQNRRSSIRGPPVNFYNGRRTSPAVRPPYKGLNHWAQSRVGPPTGYRHGPHGSFGGPEIIYTKPPGYGNSEYERGKNPYEDASAWFPDANYPPPDVNVYHSQLYAQSYDPHYYNYIAKYGKIKPHLYGKFEKKKESFIWELFRSFKKHGMKHVMNPMFLLGLGIPMVTLMLSALVNKRSFARSSSAGIAGDLHVTDEEIDEWVTKLRKALECHEASDSDSERMKCAVSD